MKFKFFILSREPHLGNYFSVGDKDMGPGSECLGLLPARLDIYQLWDLSQLLSCFIYKMEIIIILTLDSCESEWNHAHELPGT